MAWFAFRAQSEEGCFGNRNYRTFLMQADPLTARPSRTLQTSPASRATRFEPSLEGGYAGGHSDPDEEEA